MNVMEKIDPINTNDIIYIINMRQNGYSKEKVTKHYNINNNTIYLDNNNIIDISLNNYKYLIWIDSDCVMTKNLDIKELDNMFGDNECIYGIASCDG